MPKLILKIDKNKQKNFPVTSPSITIGRKSDNTIYLNNKIISRYHAIVEIKNNSCTIRDLLSKNGTYVNGRVIKECVLKNKDNIRIGPFQFSYDAGVIESIKISDESPLEILQQVGKAINRVTDEEDLTKLVMDLIFKSIRPDRGMVLILDKTTNELVPRLIRGDNEDNQNITVSKTIIDSVLKKKLALIIKDIDLDPGFSGKGSIIASGIKSVMAVPMLVRDEIIGIVQVDTMQEGVQFSKEDLDILCSFSDYLAIGMEQAKLNEMIKKETRLRANLERFHSPEVVNMIVSSIEEKGDIDFAVEEKEISIFFADICNFTPMSERLDAVEIALLVNEYFTMVTEIIFDNGGTLDKYIGDAVMALFGAPYEQTDHADRAAQAAIDIRKEMKGYMEKIEPSKRFEVTMGINSGIVVAGNIGSQKRMEYSVLGDPVNVASRLCSLCSPGQVLIGEQTKILLSEKYHTEELGRKKIKGKSNEVLVYELET